MIKEENQAKDREGSQPPPRGSLAAPGAPASCGKVQMGLSLVLLLGAVPPDLLPPRCGCQQCLLPFNDESGFCFLFFKKKP